MKRVLLASTALCLGAGTAAAQDMMMDGPSLALSGSAEMGVAGSKDDEARFHTDIDVTFKATGTTDAGVTWSADVDLDEVSDDTNTNSKGETVDAATQDDDDDGGVTVSISQPQGFGTITMGDTAGAIAWAVSDARGAGPGSIRDNHEHGGSSGNDGLDARHDNQILQWNRGIGSGFSLAASIEIDDDADGAPGTRTFDPILGVGGKYSMPMGVGTLGLGAGFQMGSFAHSFAGGLTGTQRAANATAAANGVKAPNEADDLWYTPKIGTEIKKSGREVDATAIGASVSLDFGNGADGIKVIGDAGLMEADGSVTGTAGGAATQTMDVEAMHMGLGVGYTVGAISLGVNVGTSVTEDSYDASPSVAASGQTTRETTKNGIGFSAAYDLGGGAALQFGVGSAETEYDWTVQGDATLSGGGNGGYDHSTDTNSWSLGLKFAF